jgi:hypothetical protein
MSVVTLGREQGSVESLGTNQLVVAPASVEDLGGDAHVPLARSDGGLRPLSLKLGLFGHMPKLTKPIMTSSSKSMSCQAAEPGIETEELRRPRGQETERPVFIHVGDTGRARHALRLVTSEGEGPS